MAIVKFEPYGSDRINDYPGFLLGIYIDEIDRDQYNIILYLKSDVCSVKLQKRCYAMTDVVMLLLFLGDFIGHGFRDYDGGVNYSNNYGISQPTVTIRRIYIV